MAQLFSNTYVGTLDKSCANIAWRLEEVPDLMRYRQDGSSCVSGDTRVSGDTPSEGHAWNFSDGIGSLSPDAMAQLAAHLGGDVPAFASGRVSAFQFRFKGFS